MDDPICMRCEQEYCLRDGREPSPYCDECAHLVIAKMMSFDDPDYNEWEKHLQRMFNEATLTWIPALLIEAMKMARKRGAFSATGMSSMAAKIERQTTCPYGCSLSSCHGECQDDIDD